MRREPREHRKNRSSRLVPLFHVLHSVEYVLNKKWFHLEKKTCLGVHWISVQQPVCVSTPKLGSLRACPPEELVFRWLECEIVIKGIGSLYKS